jgi:putative two-component system response regulator
MQWVKLNGCRRKEAFMPINHNEHSGQPQSSDLDIIKRLALAVTLTAEYKDESPSEHLVRVGIYSGVMAQKLGLPEEEAMRIRNGAILHDVGKIGIPDTVLLKQGILTDEEFEIMKSHTTIGARILKNQKCPLLNTAQEIALTHHEKFDGTGYPQQLAGHAIPISGRIVGLADTFDVLTSKRPYKSAYPIEIAFGMIEQESGSRLDPELVDIFLKNRREIAVIHHQYTRNHPVAIHEFIRSGLTEQIQFVSEIMRII